VKQSRIHCDDDKDRENDEDRETFWNLIDRWQSRATITLAESMRQFKAVARCNYR
jgi:hypothetical protein